ncbi:hypothetical protein F5X68DRAFT_194259 [Plectosphaerella plurivora]|uniref:Uncharacterized protein n=1 Tax=Plectosphaerella plurivora TaxID=936078 RepID=A0A9P8V3R1_9PEZI|nr:hypothetical protein F5X68DRAFT_194259 [Plectosphaerella plurivora]
MKVITVALASALVANVAAAPTAPAPSEFEGLLNPIGVRDDDTVLNSYKGLMHEVPEIVHANLEDGPNDSPSVQKRGPWFFRDGAVGRLGEKRSTPNGEAEASPDLSNEEVRCRVVWRGWGPVCVLIDDESVAIISGPRKHPTRR